MLFSADFLRHIFNERGVAVGRFSRSSRRVSVDIMIVPTELAFFLFAILALRAGRNNGKKLIPLFELNSFQGHQSLLLGLVLCFALDVSRAFLAQAIVSAERSPGRHATRQQSFLTFIRAHGFDHVDFI